MTPKPKRTSKRLKPWIVFSSVFGLASILFILWNSGGTSAPASVVWPENKGKPFECIGSVSFPTGLKVEGQVVGGLSGLSYCRPAGVYYAVSDDRSKVGPARVFKLTVNLGDGRLDSGDVNFTGVLVLTDEQGKTFKKGAIDPEGIAVCDNGDFYVSSEGDVDEDVDPFIGLFRADGRLIRCLDLPEKCLPKKRSGVRDNLAFESLTLSSDGRWLFAATENAMEQDGPEAGAGDESFTRIFSWDVQSGKPLKELVYRVSALYDDHSLLHRPGTNGLSELLALNSGRHFLAIERRYVLGLGMSARLFLVSAENALDVSAMPRLFRNNKGPLFDVNRAVRKTELADAASWVTEVDNLEGMAFGPSLPDGRKTLILVSDNNFSRLQKTQFIALAISDCLISGPVL